MLLDYKRLLEDGTLDKRYKSILLQIYKDSLHEYHTTWLVRCGIMTIKRLTDYMNAIPENTLHYVIPTIEEGEEPVNLEDLIDDPVVRSKCAMIFNKYRVFPYKTNGATLVWLAEEAENEASDGTSMIEEVESYADGISAKFKESKRDLYINRIIFALRPAFEEELRKFSVNNRLPYNSGDVYRIKPEFQAQYYIVKGIVNKASDIFFDPKIDGIQVAYSILNDYLEDDFLLLDPIGKKRFCDEILILTGIQPKARPDSVVVDCSIKDLGEVQNQYNGRVNLFRNLGFDAICIRVVDKSKKAIPFKILNIRESRKRGIRHLLQNNAGIILTAGATGSGKSTTNGSVLTELRVIYPFRRIETVEDPIEQILGGGISQLSLENSGATYDDVSHSLTRRNPSILFVGEFNTPVTVHFGVRSAQQDLLILSTIHSGDAKSVPDRIRGMTITEPSIYEQLLQVLRGIIHQRMLKKACPECLEIVDITDPRITNDMVRVLEYYGYTEKYVPIACPKEDCPVCQGRGFLITEPIIAVELAIIDDSLQEDILAAPKTSIGKIIFEHMRRNNLTGVQDALDYMREQQLDWFQIWYKFSLFNKVSSCVQPGDAKYKEDNFNGVISK